MKRHLAVCLVIVASSAMLVGCSDDPTTTSSSSSSSSSSSGETAGAGGVAGAGGSAGMGGTAGMGGVAGAGGAGGTAGSGGGPVVVCGDGTIAGAEECDDGNAISNDGCDMLCAVESGYSCSGAPSMCVTTCGDGFVAGNEGCDDNNSTSGDGCDEACVLELGYSCSGAPSACVTTCGDGFVAGSEACDDGNTSVGDGCNDSCVVENGHTCMGQPSLCPIVCGDGIVLGAESCDDGNLVANDGCNAGCMSELGYACMGQPSNCATICGDGFVVAAEACDDGNTNAGDGCNDSCVGENGYTCTGQPSSCQTVCGDGLVIGTEGCDDGNLNDGDGCSMACGVVGGYSCTGMPSVCVTTCGDGIVAGMETCDDGATVSNDGCSDVCTTESGFTCIGTPSVCVTTCGDGITAGIEVCDDGNLNSGDGCNATCTPSTGEDCSDTMAISQAVESNGTYTWSLPASFVGTADGDFACDPNTHGPDVVIAFVKTSANLANGGKLLHIKADTPTSTATGNYLNVEVTNSCTGSTKSEKCLWYKDNWDAYLDLPAGTYHIWVQKNSPGAFPAVDIVAEEITPDNAEGEGCFAPYTSSSAIYAPPAGAGMPHTWMLPASINSFDIGPTWGEPGSISCDNNVTYGDIHGVDAVIEFDKQSAMSVLKIDVQNTDPTLTQSDLDVEVLSVCDALDPTKISRHCRANLDTVAITAPSPAGLTYLWVSTEGTSEEFQGATVQVTEIFPNIGESWPTAEPLAGSASIVATSTQRLDAPTCFPAGTNIHWFSYTMTKVAFSLLANAPGAVGIYDANGQQLACQTDMSAAPFGLFATPGQTIYIAVQSPTTITSLNIADVGYAGVGAAVTDLDITFPSSATAENAMSTDGSQIFLSDLTKVFVFPNVVGSTAIEYGTTQGITSTHLGYDTVFANGSLFSVDSATSTTASRLFRIYNGSTWGPGTAWDLTPTYTASSPTYAIGTDGTNLFMASRRTTVSTDFYSVATNASNTPVLLGTAPGVWYAVGLAVDDQYFYVASNGTSGEGVYRVSRTNISGIPKKLATLATSTTGNGIEVDSFINPQYLYVREYGGDTHAIIQPAGAFPVHPGAINTLGSTSDYAMTYDKANGALYIFETETDTAGRIVRIK